MDKIKWNGIVKAKDQEAAMAFVQEVVKKANDAAVQVLLLAGLDRCKA